MADNGSVRFKLDENVPVKFRRLLVDAGHDVATPIDEGLVGAGRERRGAARRLTLRAPVID